MTSDGMMAKLGTKPQVQTSAPNRDETLAIQLITDLNHPSTVVAAEEPQQQAAGNPLESSIGIDTRDLRIFVQEVLLEQAKADAEAWRRQHARGVEGLERELGISEGTEISVGSVHASLTSAGLGIQPELINEAAQRYHNRRNNEKQLAEWRSTLRLPQDASLKVVAGEAALSEVFDSFKQSLGESIAQALAKPSSIAGGKCLILWNRQMTTRAGSPLNNYLDRTRSLKELEINHGIRIEDDYNLIIRIPYVGKDTFELLSPEIKETVARPEPNGFLGRLWYILAGPTVEVVHPEKRGLPVTSPALYGLCKAIEAAGAVPVLVGLASDSGYISMRLSIKLCER